MNSGHFMTRKPAKLNDKQESKLHKRLQESIRLVELLKLLDDNVDIINKSEASTFMALAKNLMIKELYIAIIAIIKDNQVKAVLKEQEFEEIWQRYSDIRNKHLAHIVQNFNFVESPMLTIPILENDLKKIFHAINSISSQKRWIIPSVLSEFHTSSLRKIINLINADNRTELNHGKIESYEKS